MAQLLSEFIWSIHFVLANAFDSTWGEHFQNVQLDLFYVKFQVIIHAFSWPQPKYYHYFNCLFGFGAISRKSILPCMHSDSIAFHGMHFGDEHAPTRLLTMWFLLCAHFEQIDTFAAPQWICRWTGWHWINSKVISSDLIFKMKVDYN